MLNVETWLLCQVLTAENLATAQRNSAVGLHQAAVDMQYTSKLAPFSQQTSSQEDNLYDSSLADLDRSHDAVQSKVHQAYGKTAQLASERSQVVLENAKLGAEALALLSKEQRYV